MSAPTPFTEWLHWEAAPKFTTRSFQETVDGGQAFRWKQINDYYEGRWGGHVIRLKYEDRQLLFSAPETACLKSTLQALGQYFAVDTDFESLSDALPHRSDPVLKLAVEAFSGLRILRQPFEETVFCFLCSSTKQIPQIKAICESVALDLGSPLADESHALPTWKQIVDGSEDRLRAAKLGYRARYIYQSALFLAERPGWLASTEALPTAEARERLMQLPGVGRKIADCSLLFGAGRLDAFPIDTWVEKILSTAYQLEGWKTPQLQDFARIHFGTTAGFAQQYLFAAARAGVIAS